MAAWLHFSMPGLCLLPYNFKLSSGASVFWAPPMCQPGLSATTWHTLVEPMGGWKKPSSFIKWMNEGVSLLKSPLPFFPTSSNTPETDLSQASDDDRCLCVMLCPYSWLVWLLELNLLIKIVHTLFGENQKQPVLEYVPCCNSWCICNTHGRK